MCANNSDKTFTLQGNIIDVVNCECFTGTVFVQDGKIAKIVKEPVANDCYICPGFIDAHVHIESSMLVPSEFARLAVPHGTVATVSDPHEIANVLGLQGVRFMLENASQVPFKFYFGAPSCVPATNFETSGACLGVEEIASLLERDEIKYLAEMMNFPGVIYDDPEVVGKLAVAKKLGKPVDGHAPGLKGVNLEKYYNAGISTDHECFSIDEAREKVALGMNILIREGTAAKNFDSLIKILLEAPDSVMFCSDDKHSNDLVLGHINQLLKRALMLQIEPISVFRAATFNPVKHYKLDVGLLQPGDPADLVVFDNLVSFNILQTFINGSLVAENGKSIIKHIVTTPVNRFVSNPITKADLSVKAVSQKMNVIEVIDGELITKKILTHPTIKDSYAISDVGRDILKLVVVNRYQTQRPAIGFVKNFGLQRGAVAQSIAHDSHNIIAVGTNDLDLENAINSVIDNKGGLVAVDGDNKTVLALPVAGLMSTEDGYNVAKLYNRLNLKTYEMGSHLHSPWMTLSFLALLVIPELKLSDKGLFDGNSFQFTSLFVQ